MKTVKGIALAVAVGLAAGCNISTEGAEGRILFTPDNCGRIGCDFEDSLGTGGAIEVHIQSTGRESLVGADLLSDDESVLTTTPLGVVNGLLTFGVVAVGPGVARLVAVDAEGFEIDFLEVGVQDVEALRLDVLLGAPQGPESDGLFDEIWTLQAGVDTSFLTTPLIGEGVPTMGVFSYQLSTTTPELFDFLDETAEPDIGNLQMTLPEGQFDLVIESDFTPPLSVLIDVLP